MIRLLFFFLIVVVFPLLLISGIVLSIIFAILMKFNIIKSPFGFKTKIETAVRRKKSFAEATIRQLSCKHQNLEQKETLLLCSDCGKIIKN
jgi:hypothetical protein